MESYFEDTEFGRTRRFEITNSFPTGYQVWNIGREHFKHECYIPVCLADENFHVDIYSLKAVRLESEEMALFILDKAARSEVNSENIADIINQFKKTEHDAD